MVVQPLVVLVLVLLEELAVPPDPPGASMVARSSLQAAATIAATTPNAATPNTHLIAPAYHLRRSGGQPPWQIICNPFVSAPLATKPTPEQITMNSTDNDTTNPLPVLPAAAAQDLQAARATLMVRLLSSRWSQITTRTWAGRVCARLLELEHRIEVALRQGNTTDALGYCGDACAHYRAAARRGPVDGAPFGSVDSKTSVLLDRVESRTGLVVSVYGTPADDGAATRGAA